MMDDAADLVRDFGPALALVGVFVTLVINGRREDRRQRREDHARALTAVVAYMEMPYRIRRRRHEQEFRSSERVRLSDAFSDIQAELENCEALMRSDPSKQVRDNYAKLIEVLRQIAGSQAVEAWNTDPVADDTQIGMSDVNRSLDSVRSHKEICEQAMALSLRSWLTRTHARRRRRAK